MHNDRLSRDELRRLEALRHAYQSSQESMTTEKIIERAEEFERFVKEGPR